MRDMLDRLKELKFWGPGDEAGELFQATCGLCHRMWGTGDYGKDKAELLFGWAKEQAHASQLDAEANDFDKSDFITGDSF